MPKQSAIYRLRKPIKEEPKSNIEFSKYLSLGAPTLIFFGLFKLYFYYAYFHINIIPFLEFGEMATAFLDIAILGLFSIFFVVTWVTIVFQLLTRKLKTTDKIIRWAAVLLTTVLALSALPLMEKYFPQYYLMLFLSLLSSVVFLWIASYKHEKRKFELMSEDAALFVSFLAIALGVLFAISFSNATAVTKRKSNYGITVTYSDSTKPFISDSNTYYIGKTNNYLFIYNEKNKKTIAQKMDNVKSIEFPEPK